MLWSVNRSQRRRRSLFNRYLAAGQRFVFVDVLRGLAALTVAMHHIYRYGPLPKAAAAVTPSFLITFFNNGKLGVEMFFVISGFVIAYTLREARITPRYLGNFALRRSLRLDPPYWCTIVFVIVLYALADRLFDVEPRLLDNYPSWQQLLAHVFYLQNILGYGNLSVGFWTLCIEVQFYLTFAILLGLSQYIAIRRGAGKQQQTAVLAVVFLPLALASLFWFSYSQANTDWVIHFFAFFFLGALAWWSLEGRTPRWMFWSFVAAIVARQCYHHSLDMTVAVVTGVTIYSVIRAGRGATWLNWSWLERLGRISYSLYLIHYPISWIITTLGYELTGDAPVMAVFWLVLSLVASIGVAQAMHVAVESPAIRLAHRLKGFARKGPAEVYVPAAAASAGGVLLAKTSS